jgi:hypothetical protein
MQPMHRAAPTYMVPCKKHARDPPTPLSLLHTHALQQGWVTRQLGLQPLTLLEEAARSRRLARYRASLRDSFTVLRMCAITESSHGLAAHFGPCVGVCGMGYGEKLEIAALRRLL